MGIKNVGTQNVSARVDASNVKGSLFDFFGKDDDDVEELDLEVEDDDDGFLFFSKKYYGEKDYKTITDFELNKKKSLEDIVHFINLESLSINGGKIDDYSYLNELSKLEELEIGLGSEIINLNQINNSNIKDLSIFSNNYTGDFSGMPNIERLTISYTDLSDLSSIANLKNLTNLSLDHNLITDVSSLYDSNIERLSLEYNSINEIDLSRLPNLKSIYISGNYNLYTNEILDYCESHNISIDIDREDVEKINSVKGLVEGLNLDGLSDLEKEEKIYRFVLDYLDYDIKKVDISNSDPIGVALDGTGVCISYAELFKAMCNVSGINNFLSTGHARGSLKKFEVPLGGPHAWNMVEIDGQYYLCDPTNDDSGESFQKRIIQFFKGLFSDNEYTYYNLYGKDAKDFTKTHKENMTGERKDQIDQNELALNVISIDTSVDAGRDVACDTAIASTDTGATGIRAVTSEFVERVKALVD